MKNNLPTLKLIAAMTAFGTIGVFVRYVGMPSGFIAMVRGFVGVLFLLLVMLVSGRRIALRSIGRLLPILILSGALIGINWIFLFEAYRYTTVATATVCYYMAPVFLMLVAPLLLRERITAKKAICVLFSIIGMVLVSGLAEGFLPSKGDALGILLGLLAAALYTSVIVLNKKIGDRVSPYDRTAVQLLFAAVTVLPYVLLAEQVELSALRPLPIAMLLILGVLHTGIAYALYFSSLADVSAEKVSVYSYIDPILAVLLSAFLLGERITPFGWIGSLLVLVSTLIASLDLRALWHRIMRRDPKNGTDEP